MMHRISLWILLVQHEGRHQKIRTLCLRLTVLQDQQTFIIHCSWSIGFFGYYGCSLLDRRANKKRSERDWSYVSNELPNELKYWRSPFMAIDNFRFSMGEEDTEGDSRIQHRSTSWLFCWAQRRQSLPLGFHHHRPTRISIPRGNILSWHHISTWLSFQASQGVI